jgi:UDP-glucose 4-epimerase
MISAGTRVLVTGGAGFIGSHLVELLVSREASVTVVDNLVTGNVRNLDAVSSDVLVDARSLGEALADPGYVTDFDVVFHLAANPYIPPSVEDPPFDFALNLDLTFRLLEVLRLGARRPRLVFTSSAAVYGNPVRLPIHEADPTTPISPYGVSKLAAERYVAVYSQLYSMPCSSVRLFSVYGPRQRKQVVFDLLERLSRDPERLEVLGDGTQERDFVYVEDVAGAMVAVADRAPGAGEVVNVASGTTHTIADLITTIADALGVQPELVYTGSVRPGDAERWSVDTSALRALGYEVRTDLAGGVASTRDWHRGDHRS